jgi:hypothetical protein
MFAFGEIMYYLRYLWLFVDSGVQHILCFMPSSFQTKNLASCQNETNNIWIAKMFTYSKKVEKNYKHIMHVIDDHQ